jgi:hypothetical protein
MGHQFAIFIEDKNANGVIHSGLNLENISNPVVLASFTMMYDPTHKSDHYYQDR